MMSHARLVALSLLAVLAAIGATRSDEPPAQPQRRNIGGPGDYALREKVVETLSLEPGLASEAPTVILVNGGVVFSGEISTWSLKRRALTIAAGLRGVVNVTDQMTIKPAALPDDTLRKAIVSLLAQRAEEIGPHEIEVEVEGAAATLSGTVPDFKTRVQAEAVAGTVLGVVRIANHLRPANAPSGTDDASIAEATAAYLGNVEEFPYPVEIEVGVRNGVVTLSGRVAFVLARQQAAVMAALVGGVRDVALDLEIDPGMQVPGPTIKVAK